jgi:hypothetical protein
VETAVSPIEPMDLANKRIAGRAAAPLGAHYSPGERGKTKPLGAALALKAAGTAFIVAPKLVACDRMIGPT